MIDRYVHNVENPFPKNAPEEWVFNQVACQFREAPEEVSSWEKEEHTWRIRSWFGEYVKRSSTGHVTFGVSPPSVRQGNKEKLRKQIEELYTAFELLFAGSAEKTIKACYVALTERDLRPSAFQVPWSPWAPFIFGVPVFCVGYQAPFYGAFTDDAFKQVEPLVYNPDIWAWHTEGPLAVMQRFEQICPT